MRSVNKSSIIVVVLIIVLLSGYSIWRTVIMQEKEMELLATNDLSEVFYKNPVGNISNIGDPYVFRASNGMYYCYPTSWNMGFKAWESEDMVNWYDLGPVYKGYVSWGSTDFWAPEVVEYEGKYYMYYTARWTKNKSLRIGVSVSDSPKGPFKDVYDHPMFDFGYAVIDANIFIDEDGRKYMFYSKDCSENIVDGRHESHIYGVELNDDMITLKGEPVLLLKPDQDWEFYSGNTWRWNEGATVLKHNSKYYMMYSANFYASKMYSIGYATADSILGTYVKYERNPILEAELTWQHVSGPGHNSIAPSPDGSELFIIYHTHTNPKEGGGNRQIFIDRMGFRPDGTIYVNGPTVTEQPLPSGASEYINIAASAKINVSSEKEGHKKEALTDGELSLYLKNSSQEWVSEGGDKTDWVKLEWEEKQKISSILIYNSVLKNRKALDCKVTLSNGQVIKQLQFPDQPGAAAVASFPETEVQWLKIEFDKSLKPDKEIGISELYVLGRK